MSTPSDSQPAARHGREISLREAREIALKIVADAERARDEERRAYARELAFPWSDEEAESEGEEERAKT